MSQKSILDIATSFLELVVSGKVRDAYNKHVGQHLVHHNPYFKGDRESLLDAMEKDAIENPNKDLEIKLTLVDGNLVTTYSHLKRWSNDLGFAVIHIFRIKNSQIIEMWDLVHELVEDSPNEYGMF